MAPRAKKQGIATELAVAAAPPAAASGPAFRGMSLESFADLGRENFAAMTRVNEALSAGWQAMSEEILGLAQLSMASAAKTASALLQARTLDEVVELSNAHARSSFAALTARGARLSELGVSMAGGVFAPFVARAGSINN